MKVRGRFNLVMENVLSKEEEVVEKKANYGLKALMIVSLMWLLSRAFFLQVVTGEQNSVSALRNQIEIKRTVSERGIVKDRFGMVLARNGLNKEGEVVREYPLGEGAAHLLGYVGEISKEEMEGCVEECFEAGDLIGKMGLEKIYNRDLTGTKTEELVEVNAKGDIVRTLGKKEGVAGKTINLTIDGELQKTISRVLQEDEEEKEYPVKGAVVVNKVENGEVLALVSWPSFDANLFSGGERVFGKYKSVEEILADSELKPMFNRSLGGAFPPGSVYKLVTAVAGIEEGYITRETTIQDTGELKVGEYRYGSWYFDQYGGTEGVMDLTKGLARSNDIFFYKVGESVGIAGLEKWSKIFGLGSKTNLNWPGEVSGLVPNSLEKERRTGERWFLGNTYHLAIGQGDLLASPIQIARMTSGVVSGRLCDLKMSLEGDTKCKDLGIKKATREMVLSGMKAACSPGGTAFPFFDFKPLVACKTGTAQHGGEETLPHAWISVVVPKVNGESLDYERGVVITVLLEEAGEGSYEAGPVALKIAKFIVERQY